MAKKTSLTRPELKRQRDSLARYTRYLPMLKLKQQQLQITVRDAVERCEQARAEVEAVRQRMRSYQQLLREASGVNVRQLAEPDQVATGERNIAGVRVPTFKSVSFPQADYSLFATPAWVDRALADLRELNERRARLDVLTRQRDRLEEALTKITQRVNLFGQVLIPDAREAIRVIRIWLGDEQTAAVARAKLAKAKLSQVPTSVLAVTDDREEAQA